MFLFSFTFYSINIEKQILCIPDYSSRRLLQFFSHSLIPLLLPPQCSCPSPLQQWLQSQNFKPYLQAFFSSFNFYCKVKYSERKSFHPLMHSSSCHNGQATSKTLKDHTFLLEYIPRLKMTIYSIYFCVCVLYQPPTYMKIHVCLFETGLFY